MAAPMSLRIHVAHVNHGLRGDQADADARFVEELAHEAGMPFHLRTLALSYQREKGRRHASPESLWREARYQALREIADNVQTRCVALGHTQDDLAETVLMRLMRGTGLEGLGAFGPTGEVAGLRLCRPLIETTRQAIEQHARDQGLRWREDASNGDLGRMRNRIRRGLIPYLQEQFNPSIQEALARTAQLAQCENAWLESQADEVWRQWVDETDPAAGVPEKLGLDAMRTCPTALLRRLLRRWVMAVSGDAYPPTCQETQRLQELIVSGKNGTCYEHQRRWRFQKTREHVIVMRLARQERGKLDIKRD